MARPYGQPYRDAVGYDWKKLERDEAEQHDRTARSMGLSYIVIGLIGPAVGFLITGSFEWVSGVVWLVIGLVAFVPAAVVLRPRSKYRGSD